MLAKRIRFKRCMGIDCPSEFRVMRSIMPIGKSVYIKLSLRGQGTPRRACCSNLRTSHGVFDLLSPRNPGTMRIHTAPAQSVPFIEKGNMASRTVWHFAYGSNMNRAQMLSRTGKILEEHNASLPNYEVRFNKKVRGGTAGANIQLASGKTVHGVLYKIEEGAFRSLDRYEGVPDHYRRIEVQVTPEGGQPVPAQIYIASKIEKGLRPSATYLQAMLDGAGEHNLPASYIGEIKTAAGAA
jgi:gamma-glutamylcyclotransferase